MLMNFVRAVIQDRKGVSSIEYGVLAALIIAAITAALGAFNTGLTQAFTNLSAAIGTAF